MKKFSMALAVLALSLSTAAMAQDEKDREHGRGQATHENRGENPRGGGKEYAGPPAPAHNAQAPAPPHVEAPPHPSVGSTAGNTHGNRDNANAGRPQTPPRQNLASSNHDNDRGRASNRGDRDTRFGYSRDTHNGPHFNFRGRAFVSVHAPVFRYPSGYRYRHWNRGERLPLFFIATPYFVDFDWIGLPPPPYGEQWIRYGTDALLVDIYTGDVVDVIYDVFY